VPECEAEKAIMNPAVLRPREEGKRRTNKKRKRKGVKESRIINGRTKKKKQMHE